VERNQRFKALFLAVITYAASAFVVPSVQVVVSTKNHDQTIYKTDFAGQYGYIKNNSDYPLSQSIGKDANQFISGYLSNYGSLCRCVKSKLNTTVQIFSILNILNCGRKSIIFPFHTFW
jgi:hypothetical protein